MSRFVKNIVLHCTATANGRSLFVGKHGEPNFKTPVEVIDGWHAARKFRRGDSFLKLQNPSLKHIGYHFVVYTSGVVVTGRHLDEVGSGVFGFNANSVHVAMVGMDAYTLEAWQGVAGLVAGLQKRYPSARVLGHRDFSPDKNGNGKVDKNEWLKTCPGFDVEAWLDNELKPLQGHIWSGDE